MPGAPLVVDVACCDEKHQVEVGPGLALKLAQHSNVESEIAMLRLGAGPTECLYFALLLVAKPLETLAKLLPEGQARRLACELVRRRLVGSFEAAESRHAAHELRKAAELILVGEYDRAALAASKVRLPVKAGADAFFQGMLVALDYSMWAERVRSGDIAVRYALSGVGGEDRAWAQARMLELLAGQHVPWEMST